MPDTSPFFNVTDFGATGNGTTDDTAAIVAAIAAAAPASSLARTGNTVYFPAGTYMVTSTLTVPAGLVSPGFGLEHPRGPEQRVRR